MRARWLLAMVLALAVAGCFGSDTPAATPAADAEVPAAEEPSPAPAPVRTFAPWWNIGESWTVTYQVGEQPERSVTLVNFANDTFGDPEHFWLGVADRDIALENALFRSVPFLGRIHWDALAPHEHGRHSVMYSWPLEDGATWSGGVFGEEWHELRATLREDGGFDIRGVGLDGATIRYDYDPETRWFRTLALTAGDGSNILRADVVAHALEGASGAHHFLRPRDYLDHAGGAPGDEVTFTVAEEGATSIVFHVDGEATGPAALLFLDPEGMPAHHVAVPAGGPHQETVEVEGSPTPGEWTLQYVGTFSGDVIVRGIVEYKATL